MRAVFLIFSKLALRTFWAALMKADKDDCLGLSKEILCYRLLHSSSFS